MGPQKGDQGPMDTNPNPNTQQAAQPQGPALSVENYLEIALGCALRGAMMGIPHLPPAEIAVLASKALAANIGVAFVGDLATVLTIRRKCREAFAAQLAVSPAPQMAATPIVAATPGAERAFADTPIALRESTNGKGH